MDGNGVLEGMYFCVVSNVSKVLKALESVVSGLLIIDHSFSYMLLKYLGMGRSLSGSWHGNI